MTKAEASISTQRFIIRPYEQRDYDNWLAQFKNRLPAQHRHDDGQRDMSECTPEWFAQLVTKYQARAKKDRCYVFGVFRKIDGVCVGDVDISTLMRGEFQWARIGYAIHNHFWRNGYGKESVAGLLQIAFEQLGYHRVEAHINIDNEASIKLAESVGMEFECVRKGFIFEFDEWTDNLVYYKNAPVSLLK